MVMLVLGASCSVESDLMDGVKNMVGPDASMPDLISSVASTAKYYTMDSSLATLDNDTLKVDYFPFFIGQMPVFPYIRMGPLRFGTKQISLTFYNNVGKGSGAIAAFGSIGQRTGNTIKMGSIYGLAYGSINPKYTYTVVETCSGYLFWRTCVNTWHANERALYPSEIERVVSKLQREVSLKMVSELSAKTGLRSEEASFLSGDSLYISESLKIRNLYTQLEYDSSEIWSVESSQLEAAIRSQTKDKVTAYSVLSKVRATMNNNSKANFLVAPTEDFFFVFGINKVGNAFNLRVSTFKVNLRLPVGAFAISTGAWRVENAGEGANPSLHMLLSIFPPNKY